jgi:hypothetical protein
MTLLPETASQAIRAAEAILCCGIAISACEHLAIGKHFEPGGMYAAPPGLAANEAAPRIFSKAVFFSFVWLRLALAALVLVGWPAHGGWHAAELFLLAIVGILVNTRIPAGLEGSEQMTMIVLLGLALAALYPGNAFVENCCVWFLALQSALGYATAGLAKMKAPAWRNGEFLANMLNTGFYGSPRLARIFSLPARARLGSWFIMIFEALFPLALLDWRIALIFVAGGALFHLTNAFAMGLNSFIWPFASTYPAILYCAWMWRH